GGSCVVGTGGDMAEWAMGTATSLFTRAGWGPRRPAPPRLLLFETTAEGGIRLKESVTTLGGTGGSDISFEKLIVLITLFIAVVVAVVAITKGQRRIPTQSAKHVRGRRVYGGTRPDLPLRVNQAGAVPGIFARSP